MAKKAKKQKISIVGIAIVAVIAVCAILAIVGVCIDEWTTTESLAGLKVNTSFSDYIELAEKERDVQGGISDIIGSKVENDSLLQPMVAFGLIAVVAAGVLLVLAVLGLFVKGGLFRTLVGIMGFVTLAAGIISIAITASFCGDFLILGAGAILTAVGAMGAGLAGAARMFIKK